jgi:membrane dipeptidase
MFVFSTLLVLATVPGRVVVDTHSHVTMSRAAKPLFRGEPGEHFETWSTRPRIVNQLEVDQLQASHTTLLLSALWIPLPLRPGRDSLDETLNQLHVLKQYAKGHSGFEVVETPAQARAAIAAGRIALVPAIEGGEGIQSVEDLDRLYAAGARSITLVHFGNNDLGGAAYGQMTYNTFSTISSKLEPEGLTELGKQVVARMLALGMIVDVSHASDKTVDDVLKIAEQYSAPVINTHSGSREYLGIERNITDANAARIAKIGGTVGVTLSDHMVLGVPEADRWPGYVEGTCDDVIAHWKRMGAAAGYDHLTLGSDFNGFISRPKPGGSCPNGVRNASDLNEFFDALVAHGVPKDSLDQMGERFLQLWELLEKKADPVARQEADTASPDAHRAFDVAL